MSLITILFLALSLSADAFAVAVGAGIIEKKVQIKKAFLMALTFGVFQGIMPVIGFYVALLFSDFISSYDHWIAFILLGYIGINMIHEGWKGGEEENIEKNIFSIRSLLVLGIATSIDALAVGVSLTAVTSDIFFPALCIGCVTFITSWIGVEFGQKFGKHIGSRSEIIGGLILVGIGTKILIEHLYF